jgi:hypothetical protein
MATHWDTGNGAQHENRHIGPKGRDMKAQGNALGQGHRPTRLSPDGA